MENKIIIPKEEPKQETLEEAAKENFKGEYVCNGIDIVPAWREGFIIGAKWQQERSYSEVENMFNTLKRNSINNVATITNVDLFINSWKKEFKNK